MLRSAAELVSSISDAAAEVGGGGVGDELLVAAVIVVLGWGVGLVAEVALDVLIDSDRDVGVVELVIVVEPSVGVGAGGVVVILDRNPVAVLEDQRRRLFLGEALDAAHLRGGVGPRIYVGSHSKCLWQADEKASN